MSACNFAVSLQTAADREARADEALGSDGGIVQHEATAHAHRPGIEPCVGDARKGVLPLLEGAPHQHLAAGGDLEHAIVREVVRPIWQRQAASRQHLDPPGVLDPADHLKAACPQWYDDRMRLNNHVHIGVAVAVEDGLVVPVVRFANEQSLPQIGVAVKDYAVRARNKKLTPQEMEGSTFTISNLGMFGIESFTSIINQPNSAILSVGAIVQKPVVKNGQIAVGNTMKLTLACDHRTVDGVTGAQFLQTLQGYIENPVTMLV